MEQLRVLWDWKLKASKGYSLKGCHKSVVAVDRKANTFPLGHVPWPCLTSLCFLHDPGNNWGQSQLLRVLSKRGLHSDKAAQVLAAEGTPPAGLGRGTEQQGEAALLGCGEV